MCPFQERPSIKRPEDTAEQNICPTIVPQRGFATQRYLSYPFLFAFLRVRFQLREWKLNKGALKNTHLVFKSHDLKFMNFIKHLARSLQGNTFGSIFPSFHLKHNLSIIHKWLLLSNVPVYNTKCFHNSFFYPRNKIIHRNTFSQTRFHMKIASISFFGLPTFFSVVSYNCLHW